MKLLNVFALILTVAVTPAAMASEKGHGSHWTYEGSAGPEHWSDLDPKFSACAQGKSQSPINLVAGKSGSRKIEVDYKPSALNVVNNGHTIKVSYDKGSSVVMDGNKFNLLQFHFHTPSEHTAKGAPYPIELHMVHQSDDGQLGVIGVFFKEGAKNKALSTVWKRANDHIGMEHTPEGVSINAADFLPADRTHHNYSGSLTTPPCSENVNWNVMVTPLEASSSQIKKLQRLFKANARPVQKLHGRSLSIMK